MGFLKDLVGIAAPIAGTIIGGPVGGAIGGALGGLASGSNAPKAQTATTQQQLDPRMQEILFGADGKSGILSQYQGFMNQPRSDAAQNFANANGNYLSNNGGADMQASRDVAYKAMQGNSAPQAALPAYAVGNQVQAPSQNNIDLSGSYNSLINGAPGANPYLTGAIQKGINQSTNAFGNMVTDAKSATNDVLGSIRGNSVLAGQFGGSRQGIAEGKAIDSMNTNLARAASQFGQNNTDAAVAAQAGAYDADRNRQLTATMGLGAQQYAVAGQNAATKNAAEFTNVGNAVNNNQFNAGLQQQNNSLNSSNNLAGAGLLSGLTGNASNQVNANDNWQLGRAQGVNSLLAPHMGAGGSTTSSQPLYNNQAGNALGGAMLGGQLAGMFGGTSTGSSSAGNLLDMFGIGSKTGGLFGAGSFF